MKPIIPSPNLPLDYLSTLVDDQVKSTGNILFAKPNQMYFRF